MPTNDDGTPNTLEQCKLCQSIHKTGEPGDSPETRACFKARWRQEQYQPSSRSKAIITLTCGAFSHVRSACIVMKR